MPEAKIAPNLPDWMLQHVHRYLSSGGTEGHMYTVTPEGYPEMTVPALLLTTKGRKSGEKYLFPLFYGRTGDSYIIVASKGGAPEHPGWYRNILADPMVEVQVGTEHLQARARTATGEERARLWQEALKFWPPYADYEKKTEREIPVVVLDPVR
ncbi:nitroreductase family deazaflavin-dependent oxidoreductase [Paracraurococcus lichenis]|uniref:Nitroreductase family deazaflavin-dependent oxidoreductase n=1 Tax=Paracraurococcus lichenis TaxID=3064888 RepID=A0ABT9DUS5_9PROT|nr:nitroreductase family deazaflavin-dependent oxidoreductase [Paracraurococcus sp. LOR1-02]MDO9707652.1 nitroreductase family deazaflavin-dependent oxidoreductase [Paracraurococcus sp. LOR1-02]